MDDTVSAAGALREELEQPVTSAVSYPVVLDGVIL